MAPTMAAALSLALLLLQPGAVSAWDYAQNGLNWDKLGYCGAGGTQSPIDLPDNAPGGSSKGVYLRYPAMNMAFKLYNNGNSIAFTVPSSYKAGFGFVESAEKLTGYDSEVYRLWQVNFHSPSEHTLAGQRMPLEMQMVHQRVTGGNEELAVVSVLFKDVVGFRSNFLDVLMANGLPEKAWDEVTVNVDTNPAPGVSDLQDMVKGSSFYTYRGSLTVPPCELGVTYFVRRHTVSALPAQLHAFTAALKATAMPAGNFRNFVPGSTAAGTAKLVNSVDQLAQPTADVAPHAGSSGPSQATSADTSILSDPDFAVVKVGDSDEMKSAKSSYQDAKMKHAAAMAAKANAERALQQAQTAMDASPGLVDKINQKWSVTTAEQGLSAAEQGFRDAQKALDAAGAKLIGVHKKETAPKAGELPGMTTATPTEFGSNKPATTANPYPGSSQESAKKQEGLQFTGRVQLPTGLDASPFVGGNADSEVSIGGSSGYRRGANDDMRLAPNLKQLDAPEGMVPVANVVNPPTTGEDEEGPRMQLVVRLPTDPSTLPSLEEQRAWGQELARAVEQSENLPFGSVMVPDVRPHTFTLTEPVPLNMNGASLAQTFKSANISRHAAWSAPPRRLRG